MRNRHSERQIIKALQQHEAGTSVADICRKLNISDSTFYVWRQKYAGMTVADLKRLKELEAKYARLKRKHTEASMEKRILQRALQKIEAMENGGREKS